MINIINKSKVMYKQLGRKLKDKSGENYVDTGVKILIAVVIGGTVISWLIWAF